MIDISRFNLRRLTADMPLLPFRCADKDLNEFLVQDAKNYLNDMMAVTYVFIDPDKQQIAAYFSLLNDKVAYDPQSKSIWNRINRHIHNSKRRRSYPSVKVARLAVGEEYMNSGLGSRILEYIKLWYADENRAGCRFLTVDAYRDATKFYEKNGFEYFTTLDVLDSTRLMYFDLKDIKDQLQKEQ